MTSFVSISQSYCMNMNGRQPPSDSCLIFIRGEELMNYPNGCCDRYLRVLDQKKQLFYNKRHWRWLRMDLNGILGSILTRPMKTGGQGSGIHWKGASVTLDISHWLPFGVCIVEAVRTEGVVDSSSAEVQMDWNARKNEKTSLLPTIGCKYLFSSTAISFALKLYCKWLFGAKFLLFYTTRILQLL